jgi:hypothetical protein
MICVVFPTFSFHRGLPDYDLRRQTSAFSGGSVIVCYDLRVGLNILLLDGASIIDLQPLVPSTKILQWQLGQNLQCKGVVPITTSIQGSKVCLEYHIFHYHGLTFILIGVPLHALLKGTNDAKA